MKIIISKDALQRWLDGVDIDEEVYDHDLYDPTMVIEAALNLWCNTVSAKADLEDEDKEIFIESVLEQLDINKGRSEFNQRLYESIYGAIEEMYETVKIAFSVFIPMLHQYRTVQFDQWLGSDIVLQVWK